MHRYISPVISSKSMFMRNYKVFPSNYTLEDYFKGPQVEKFSSEEIIEATIMDEDAKLEWIPSLARQEDGYKRENNNYYGVKP